MDERTRLAEQAHLYENWSGIDRELTEAVGRLIASRLVGRRGLELGWGSGTMYGILARKFAQMDIMEGDATLSQRAWDAVYLSDAVVFACMFEKGSPPAPYDAIVMSEVLEHVLDPRELLRLAITWLLPDGRIHIAVPNGNSLHRLLAAMAGMGKATDLSETDRRNGHRRVYTWDSIREEVEKAGLEVTHMEGVLLKPLPGEGMNRLTANERERLFGLAPACPKLCAEVYVECRRRESC